MAGGKTAAWRASGRASAGVVGVLLLTFAVSSPASAQGIFERIFGGLRRAIEAPSRLPESARGFVDPFTSLANAINPPREQLRGEGGPAKAFCVRTCDGHFFPVQAHAGLSSAESCRAFCPASQTKLYGGSNIDHAVASNGSRYADLDNAFVYRQRLVDGCTCNGRDAFGLARIDSKSDPTLRPGDIVATASGLMAVTANKNNVADFTPVDSYRGFPQSYRDKLSELKVSPHTGADVSSSVAPPVAGNTRDDDRRRAQLEK
jgi:hypothetical protein